MHKIIVLDDLSDDGMNLLRSTEGFSVTVQTGLSGAALRESLAQYDGAICRSGVKITADSLQGNRRLKAIVRAGVGTDNIDKVAATRQGIIVMNTPAGNTVSTAEHTMAMILGLARNVAPAHASLKSGKWDRKSFSGVELRGKVLGIVGLGRIGQHVAGFARKFEMQLIGFDPFLPRGRANELEIAMVDSVDAMLPQVDFLTVHTPLTAETNKLIGTAQIQKMKKGVRLINCARGGIYDEAALVEGLENGHIAGVALDVFEQEPNTSSPFFQLPGTLCTPHLGASTEEAQRQVALEAAELLVGYLKNGEIRHAVNVAAVDVKTLRRLRGFINVAYRLGVLAIQWHRGAVSKCELQFDGEVASEDTRLLTSAFCAGLLSDASQQPNLVNAEVLCRELGIEVSSQLRPANVTFNSLITARADRDGQSFEASGSVFGKNLSRLVRLQHFPMESFIDGHLLVFTHYDVPGIIGYVGGILADEKVNIVQMAVGRNMNSPGGSAIGILNLDSPAPEKALERITQHPQIASARILRLPPPDFEPDLF